MSGYSETGPVKKVCCPMVSVRTSNPAPSYSRARGKCSVCACAPGTKPMHTNTLMSSPCRVNLRCCCYAAAGSSGSPRPRLTAIFTLEFLIASMVGSGCKSMVGSGCADCKPSSKSSCVPATSKPPSASRRPRTSGRRHRNLACTLVPYL